MLNTQSSEGSAGAGLHLPSSAVDVLKGAEVWAVISAAFSILRGWFMALQSKGRLGMWAELWAGAAQVSPGPSVCVAEMAERHNTKQILKLARDLVYKVQTLIENK